MIKLVIVTALICIPPVITAFRLSVARGIMEKAKRDEGSPVFLEMVAQAEALVTERERVHKYCQHYAVIEALVLIALYLF